MVLRIPVYVPISQEMAEEYTKLCHQVPWYRGVPKDKEIDKRLRGYDLQVNRIFNYSIDNFQ